MPNHRPSTKSCSTSRQPFRRAAAAITVLLSATIALADPPATAPSPHEQESRFLTHIHQLVTEGLRSGEGYFSADGKKMVFQSERNPANPFYEIFVLDFVAQETRRISPGVGKTTCAWIRPGTGEVLFASTHLDPLVEGKATAEFNARAAGTRRPYSWSYDEKMDLFLASPDGTRPFKQLTTEPGYDAEGSFSPDGKLIAFSSLRSAFPLASLSPEDRKRYDENPASFGDIYLMNADGTNVRRLTTEPGYDGGPFFSADGSRIIWRRFDLTGMKADVYAMKLDGSDVIRLTDFGAMSWAPFYHPTGDYAVFASSKLGMSNFELFIVDAKGEKEPVRITHSPTFDGLASFSPDGKQLTWSSGRTADGKSQIFLADWNAAAAREALAKAPARIPTTKPSAAN